MMNCSCICEHFGLSCTQCMKILCIPHCRFLIVLTLVLCSLMPYFAVNLPLSKIYTRYHTDADTLNLANDLNSKRLSKALKYFNQSDAKQSMSFYKSRFEKVPDIVVCIVSVSRDNQNHETGYLIQTAAVIDNIIKQDTYFKDTVLFVCNVDKNPHSHADATFLQRYIPVVQKLGVNGIFKRSFYFHDFNAKHQTYSRGREIVDYVYCLNVSKSFGSPYVLMLEDDVIPYRNILQVLSYTLKQHNMLHSSHSENNFDHVRHFSFLKLYYPERWQGYAFEPDRVIELVSIGLVGGGILLGVISLCAFKTNFHYCMKLFYFTFGAALTMLSVSIVGRQYIMDLRRISPQLFKFSPTPGCCTPAMFYSAHIVPELIEYLIIHSDRNKDLAINDFIQQNKIPGYILEPNLVRHIGMYTSLKNAYKPPTEFLFDIT